jgi:hypothetical protein
MSTLYFEKVPSLPNFKDLPHKILVSNIPSFQRLAEMYSWCINNAEGWNLEVKSTLESENFQVVFGFKNMAEAAIFKVTWY